MKLTVISVADGKITVRNERGEEYEFIPEERHRLVIVESFAKFGEKFHVVVNIDTAEGIGGR